MPTSVSDAAVSLLLGCYMFLGVARACFCCRPV